MTAHFCGNCGHDTEWQPLRGAGDRPERCVTCKTVFPCPRACEHFDCGERRAELYLAARASEPEKRP
jgi:hypothetical protein